MNALAYESETHDTFKSTTSTIAPGVTQSINYAYASADGQQMVYYVATADISRDDVIVQTSYKNQYVNQEFGMQKMTEQMAYADKLYTDSSSDRYISAYYKAVVGVNASFYNMSTGQPSGVCYLDGVAIGESASYNSYFAILKDGTAVVDYTTNMDKENIWQAVAGSQMLVYDGKDVTANASGSYATDRHSRTCVGVTADGKVVMMVLDGRQMPFSCGGTMHELAQIMLEQGCVAAINLDGGGSTTFVARQEGANDAAIVNRPSDGSERAVSSGLIIASLAVPSDVFDHAVLVAEENYVTPGSTVNVTATGVSPAGTAADLPEDISWQLADSNYGSITDGTFTSNGTAGDVVVQMVSGGNVVGETTIHVVVPTALNFKAESQIISYNKTVEFELTATVNDGLNEVKMKDGDVQLSLSDDALGTTSGFTFTSCEYNENVTEGTITATLVHDNAITDTLAITLTNLPDEPVVYEDCEDQPTYTPSFAWTVESCPIYGLEIVDESTGKVHSGKYALAATMSCGGTAGLNKYTGGLKIKDQFTDIDLTNAATLGMWVYLPEDINSAYIQFRLRNKETNAQLQYRLWNYGYGTTEAGHRGWQYFELDFAEANNNTNGVIYNDGAYHLEAIDFYICTRNDDANKTLYGYDRYEHQSGMGPFTYYIDDITVEYIDTGIDRVDPDFEYVKVTYEGLSDAVDMTGQTITDNTISVTARATDASGVDRSTAKAYIDGVEVTSGFTCTDIGVMTIDDVTLADGVHTFTFVISDIYGNCDYIMRQVNIEADSDIPTATLVYAETNSEQPVLGEICWLNVEADNVEKLDKVELIVNLNVTSVWELDHMVLAEGFSANYTVSKDSNDATITITRTGETSLEGHAVVAELPARMHYRENLDLSGGSFDPVDMKASVDLGLATWKDGTSSSFSIKKIDVDSELYNWYDVMKADGALDNKTHAHTHSAAAVDDKAATCTEDGYTGRTFCEGCNSVVDWGTTVEAAGHTYDFVEGVLKCTCGELFNGVWEDGKEYTDGISTGDGWKGDSYYLNGKKLIGICKVPAPESEEEFYYDFGENGVCTGKNKYTGIVEEGGNTYYSKLGVLETGWYQIEDDWYYFVPETKVAAEGSVTTEDGITFEFVDGKPLTGVWEDYYVYKRYWYGPTYYKQISKNVPYLVVEIDGFTYLFNTAGIMATGMRLTHESGDSTQICYNCGEDGKAVLYTGVYEDMYFEEGVQQKGFRLVEHEGNFYFIERSHLLADSCTVELTDTLTGLVYADGKIYYAENGEIVNGAVKVGDDIYYFSANQYYGMADGKYYISSDLLNGLLPSGTYEIKDCKIVLQKEKDGLVEESGKLYYYEDGSKVKGAVQIEEDIYYFSAKYYALADGKYYISADLLNGLLPAGTYEIKDYKIVIPEVKNGLVEEEGKLYYYENGSKVKGAVQIEEDIYYFSTKYYALADGRYYISEDLLNGILSAGTYEIKDYKIVIPEVKNGFVEQDGKLYYYENGNVKKGAVQIGEDIYYFSAKYYALADGKYYISADLLNGLLPAGTYEIKDYKIVIPEVKNGIVEEDGKFYYYENGNKVRGAVQIEEDIYYFSAKYYALADGKYYISADLLNGLLPAGSYYIKDYKIVLN